MEIFQHDPRLPAAHQAGSERINVGPDEGHGTTATKGTGTDVLGLEPQGGTNVFAASSKGGSQVLGGDGCGSAVGEGSEEGRVWRGSRLPQMKHLSDCSLDGSEQGIISNTAGNCLTGLTILLGGEVKQNHGGCCKLVQGSGCSVVTASGHLEGDILKGVVVAGVVGVFARAQQEEPAQEQHVLDGLVNRGVGKLTKHMLEQLEWNRSGLVGRRVSFLVSAGKVVEL
ncbi:hypothetical protein SEMRO_2856_G338760.1 [Seminavis robusta]|uniref:Uncharacterized protein n=1 Tax=Seminavis robusta TaxID=568900 RepID=A0A9N8F1T3_9STRA|nr:hypothetical protein SEMRO_2856_G338760.1 [Seminavis robusta]|eukprot:Sro2856_g338760.1 n/a (227) ;mRNA; r:8563-9243